MKYYIVKDLVSLNSGFSIKNENNIEEYRFSSPIIAITPKATMIDTDGNEVAKIERKLLNFLPKYDVYMNNTLAFTIKMEVKVGQYLYTLSNGYRVEGDARGLHFTIFDETNKQISIITKEILSANRKCEVSILDPDKKMIILIIAKIVALPSDFKDNSSN